MRAHDFFRETDWSAVERRTNPAPLQDIIEKHDYISFRDATNEDYLRNVAHHRHTPRDYQFNLYEFRNSH